MMRAPAAWLSLLLPASLAAQGVTLAPFAGTDRGLDDSHALVGLAATKWAGPVGFRLGGALDAASSPAAPLFGDRASGGPHAWNADLDLRVSGGRAGFYLGGVSPSVFVGFGVHGRRQLDGGTATIPVWSYGAGAGLPVTSWLELDTEARYRMPHESDRSRLPAGVGGGWELRAGLAFNIGAARPRTRVRPDRTLRLRTSPPPAAGGVADRDAGSLLDTADAYLGTPYVWGGDSPEEGFDCSGFTRWVFARQGILLPRVSRDQSWVGDAVPATRSAMRPGDLLFFAGDDRVVDHVAIYAGDGWILHSSEGGGGVGYDDLDSGRGRWFATHLVRVRRVLP